MPLSIGTSACLCVTVSKFICTWRVNAHGVLKVVTGLACTAIPTTCNAYVGYAGQGTPPASCTSHHVQTNIRVPLWINLCGMPCLLTLWMLDVRFKLWVYISCELWWFGEFSLSFPVHRIPLLCQSSVCVYHTHTYLWIYRHMLVTVFHAQPEPLSYVQVCTHCPRITNYDFGSVFSGDFRNRKNKNIFKDKSPNWVHKWPAFPSLCFGQGYHGSIWDEPLCVLTRRFCQVSKPLSGADGYTEHHHRDIK